MKNFHIIFTTTGGEMINVGELNICDNIMIELDGDISFSVDVIWKPKLLFWVTKVQAETLALLLLRQSLRV